MPLVTLVLDPTSNVAGIAPSTVGNTVEAKTVVQERKETAARLKRHVPTVAKSLDSVRDLIEKSEENSAKRFQAMQQTMKDGMENEICMFAIANNVSAEQLKEMKKNLFGRD